MLRMDVSTNFRTNYFQSTFGGYVLGLGLTIVVMNVFGAAQPALLYIVPAMLGCVFLHAAVLGEVKKVSSQIAAWNLDDTLQACNKFEAPFSF